MHAFCRVSYAILWYARYDTGYGFSWFDPDLVVAHWITMNMPYPVPYPVWKCSSYGSTHPLYYLTCVSFLWLPQLDTFSLMSSKRYTLNREICHGLWGKYELSYDTKISRRLKKIGIGFFKQSCYRIHSIFWHFSLSLIRTIWISFAQLSCTLNLSCTTVFDIVYSESQLFCAILPYHDKRK